jgi:hypothetical protein
MTMTAPDPTGELGRVHGGVGVTPATRPAGHRGGDRRVARVSSRTSGRRRQRGGPDSATRGNGRAVHLAGHRATVHDELRSGGEAGLLAGEEHDQPRHLLELAPARGRLDGEHLFPHGDQDRVGRLGHRRAGD